MTDERTDVQEIPEAVKNIVVPKSDTSADIQLKLAMPLGHVVSVEGTIKSDAASVRGFLEHLAIVVSETLIEQGWPAMESSVEGVEHFKGDSIHDPLDDSSGGNPTAAQVDALLGPT